MTNQPLSSGEQGKLLIFILLLAPSVILFFGAIPAIFLGFGLFMMKSNQDFSSIETAVKNFKGYFWLVLIGWVLTALYAGISYGIRDLFLMSIFWAIIAFVYLIIVQVLFLNPLKCHREWVSVNGVFSSKPKSAMRLSTGAEMDIIKGEKLKQYSVADELIKWAKLKEDGHISEEDFNEARAKLLKRS